VLPFIPQIHEVMLKYDEIKLPDETVLKLLKIRTSSIERLLKSA
jgi:hypothetical protein